MILTGPYNDIYLVVIKHGYLQCMTIITVLMSCWWPWSGQIHWHHHSTVSLFMLKINYIQSTSCWCYFFSMVLVLSPPPQSSNCAAYVEVPSISSRTFKFCFKLLWTEPSSVFIAQTCIHHNSIFYPRLINLAPHYLCETSPWRKSGWRIIRNYFWPIVSSVPARV